MLLSSRYGSCVGHTRADSSARRGRRLLRSEARRQVRLVEDCVQPPQSPPDPATAQPQYGHFHLLREREPDYAQAPFRLHFRLSWPSGLPLHGSRRAATAHATRCARRVQAQVQLAVLVGVQLLSANWGLHGLLLTYVSAAQLDD